MIFSARNEAGVSLLDLVLQGKKTVTRRRKPKKVGSSFAIQSERGGKTLARARVISCVETEDWRESVLLEAKNNLGYIRKLDREARREGFVSWEGLWGWIKGHYGNELPELYRIEFKLELKK